MKLVEEHPDRRYSNMDYVAEQEGEMEALLSIYENEIEVIQDSPPHAFTMPVKSEAFDPENPEAGGLFVLLRFNFTAKYPDEKPEMEVEESQNMHGDVLAEFEDFLNHQMEENLGMVMIFTIVTAAIEWLGDKCEELKEKREEEAKMKKELEEAEERKRFEGTKVTVENFLNWKKSFEEWKASERKSLIKERETQNRGKISGRQLFLQDDTLIDSDVKFLEAAGETVAVDESLFEDLDDLDLGEDEDPDWKPGDESD